MHIKVVQVGEVVTKESKQGKPYKSFEFVYDANGRLGKKMLFPSDKVGKVLKDAKSGMEFEIELEKNGDYYDWKGVSVANNETTSVASPGNGAVKAATPYKSTYETPEERARKQIFIIRQSSLSSAIAFLELPQEGSVNGPVTVEEVLDVAKKFEQFVLGDQEADVMIPRVE